MDDVQDEAAKLGIQERIDDAVSAALAKQRNKTDQSEVRTKATLWP